LWSPIPLISNAALDPFFEHERAWKTRLARRHLLITLDLRGSGLADRHCRTHSFDDYVSDMIAILDQLNIETADLVGRGNRSQVAIRFAARHPDRVRRLFLSAVTVGPTAATGRPLLEPAARDFAERNFRAYLQTAAARMSGSEAHVSAWVSHMERCIDQVGALAALDALNREDVRDDIRQIRCPCLFIKSRNSTLIDEGHVEAFQALVPHAEVAYIPNRPEMAWLEDHANAIEHFEDRMDAAEGVPLTAGVSPRETEVLALVARGLTDQEIAENLTLSVATVRRHVTNIYAKLNVRNRSEATRWALTHGIGEGTR
jgi:pimeloyl-ACP methyl ester carboxylesterase